MTTIKIAPHLAVPKVPWEAIDNLQLADKLFFKEGRDVMWTSPSNMESYPLIRVLIDKASLLVKSPVESYIT